MGCAMDRPAKVHRTYRFRIYPTHRQRLALEAQLGFACDLYNAALEQRRYAREAGRRIGYVSQCRELTELRTAEDGPPKMSVRPCVIPCVAWSERSKPFSAG